MKRSRFVYDRSVTDDLARVLAAARAASWCEPQLITLDWVVREFAEEAYEHDPNFDVDRFTNLSRYGFGRLPVAASPMETTMSDPSQQGVQQCQNQQSRSSAT